MFFKLRLCLPAQNNKNVVGRLNWTQVYVNLVIPLCPKYGNNGWVVVGDVGEEDVFSYDDFEVECSRSTQHQIRLKDDKPLS